MRSYRTLPFNHATVTHSLREYVRGYVHINGIERLWSVLERDLKGVFHKLSPRHLDRYVQEFAGRRSLGEGHAGSDGAIVSYIQGTHLRCRDLILSSGVGAE